MRKITVALLIATSAIALLPLLAPNSFETSTNPCSPCHRGYYQYLDILEDPQNPMPSTLDINETKTVSVIIQNSVNTERYSTMSSVTVTLSSSYGHLAISPPTVYLGDLTEGRKTATWQITGISDGFDYLIISASAYNTHRSDFSDNYNPYPLITVGNATGTPPPPSTPETSPPPTTTNPSPTPTQSSQQDQTTTVPPTTEIPNPSEPVPQTNQTLVVQFISPKQGESWLSQTKLSIEWNASGGTTPIEIRLQYREKGAQLWRPIATDFGDHKSVTWTTPDAAASYEIQITAIDSANPPQTASEVRTLTVVQPQTKSQFPAIPIATAALSAAAIGAFISIRRKKLNGQKITDKTTTTNPEESN